MGEPGYAKRRTAEQFWREALSYNQNLFLAYSGIGRALLRRGEPDEALKYLKLGDDRKYYSKALEKVRNATLKKYMIPCVFGLIGLMLLKKLVMPLFLPPPPPPPSVTVVLVPLV